MKFLLISPKNRTVWNFRGNLLKDIKDRGYEVTVVGPDQTDIDIIRSLGATFIEVPVNKNGTSILADFGYLRNLNRVIKDIRPDVILGYTIKPVVYGTIAGWLNGVKNINCLITGAGYTFIGESFKARVLGVIVKTLYRFSLSHGTNVIFQNADDMKEFIEKGLVEKEKCHVVNGSGVDMDYFRPADYPETMNFFMLSRLLKSKGVVEYLEACRKVKELYPEVHFSLLGKYEEDMQDMVEKDYVEEMVASGVVERYDETSDVRPYYGNCSVYVLPSYREGTPRSVLEAMSMARPIITTDTNGCRETVKEGVNGFLVPIKNSEAVKEKMICFIEHPELVKEYGKASLEYCREKYEINRVNQKMMEYMGIIGE